MFSPLPDEFEATISTPFEEGCEMWKENGKRIEYWIKAERKKHQRQIASTPSIQELFKGTTVFITGATGFLGKALVEKLLRSVPGIDRLYLLIRARKGLQPGNRLIEMFRNPLFEKLRCDNPEVFSKVIPIEGDVAETRLGMSDQDYKILEDEVDFVFHSAATVRFNHELKSAILINVRGTSEIIELAKNMKKLKAFVHLSTTFSNCHYLHIEEKIYPSDQDWQTMVKIAEKSSPADMETLHRKILGRYFNTYLYTKHLAEKVIEDAKHQLPVILARPSIVVGCFQAPLPGWNDNLNGPFGVGVACVKGVTRVVHGSGDHKLICLPVDFCSKVLIRLAWIRATGQRLCLNHEIDVVNMTTLRTYSPAIKHMADYITANPEEIPVMSIRKPRLTFTTNDWYFWFLTYTSHVFFAVFVDLLCRLVGKEPILLNHVRRILLSNFVVKDGLALQFKVDSDNFWKSFVCLKEEDLAEFSIPFYGNVGQSFMQNMKGTCAFVIKENVDKNTLERLHFILDIVDCLWQILKYTFFAVMFWKIYKSFH